MPPTPKNKKSPVDAASGFNKILGHLTQLDKEVLSGVGDRLKRERGLVDTLIKSLREGVIIIDRWGTIELINPAAEGLLGLHTSTEEKDRPSLWRALPELAGILKVSADGCLRDCVATQRELELSYPQPRIVRLFVTPMEECDRSLIVLTDITAEHAATSRHVEEARLGALTQLAAGVAHELGNPLNALGIHLQLIERGLQKEKLSPRAETIAKSLRTAQGELTRLDQIIRHFLQAIRPTPPNLQPTDLINLLEEVLTVLRAEFEGARIGIHVEVPRVLPEVMADAEQIKQIYFNLLKNAREAMEAGGTLNIVASADEQWLSVRFTDSGKGISQENLTHLFEPYFTTKVGGNGLGLMIVQKIVRAHGGQIAVESRPEQGTSMTLLFPLKQRRFRQLAPAKPQPQLPTS